MKSQKSHPGASNQLYKQARTHSSISKDYNYERLEFLGDSLLYFFSTDWVFQKWPHKSEGELTELRKFLTRKSSLQCWAKKLDLKNQLLYDKKSITEPSEKMLAGAVEAQLAAIYLVEGLTAAKAFFSDWAESLNLEKMWEEGENKTKLQVYAQALWGKPPHYATRQIHERKRNGFISLVYLPNMPKMEGFGKSKKESEENAAKKMMELLAKSAASQHVKKNPTPQTSSSEKTRKRS